MPDQQLLATFNEEFQEYFKSLQILSKYPNMLQNFKSDDVSFIVLDSDEIDLIFDIAIAFYTALYYEKKQEEKLAGALDLANDLVMGAVNLAGSIVSLIPGGQVIGSIISGVATALKAIFDIIITKTRTYPPRINDLPKLISMFIKWAKISPKNQQIIMDGTHHYVEMQKEELNDFVKEDGYVELDSFMLFYIAKNLLPQYKEMIKKATKSVGEQTNPQITDIYPQGAGKDDTNEIDFAKEPIKDSQEEKERRTSEGKSDGAILDSMRHRQTAELPGGSKYDYEYSKVGFNIKLGKAQIISPLKQFAKNAMVTQLVKEFVLMLCSMHYVRRYLALPEYNDLLIVEKHRVTDMVEEEINPALIKFNSQSKFETLKAQHERYNNGYRPTITHQVLLDLKDESVEKYYTQYNTLYAQLSEEEKAKFGYVIIDDKGNLIQVNNIVSYYDVYVHDEKYYYKDYLKLYEDLGIDSIQFEKPQETEETEAQPQSQQQNLQDSQITKKEIPTLQEHYTNIESQEPTQQEEYFMQRLATLRYLVHVYKYRAQFFYRNPQGIPYPLNFNHLTFIDYTKITINGFLEQVTIYAIQASEEYQAKYFTHNYTDYKHTGTEYKNYEIIQAPMKELDNPKRYERITQEEATEGNSTFKPYVIRKYYNFTFTKNIDKSKLQDKIAEVMIQLQQELKEIPKDKHNFDKLIQSGIL